MNSGLGVQKVMTSKANKLKDNNDHISETQTGYSYAILTITRHIGSFFLGLGLTDMDEPASESQTDKYLNDQRVDEWMIHAVS